MLHRFVGFFGSAVLAAMAAIQLNDPDPLYWVVVYLFATVAVLMTAFGKKNETALSIAVGLLVAGMLIALPGMLRFLGDGSFDLGAEMRADNHVEAAREFLGLAIALVFVVHARLARPDSGRQDSPGS